MFNEFFGQQGSKSPLIRSAFQEFSAMLLRSRDMFDHSVAALLENRELDVDLDRMDDRVDEAERTVRRIVIEHLAFAPKQDLVASLVLSSLVQDAERIGDFAKGIGEIAALSTRPRSGPFCERLQAIVAEIRPQFTDCEEAFRNDNVDKAKKVMEQHRRLKARLDEYFRDVARSPLDAEQAVVYASASRAFRRISAHLSNIASSVALPYDRIRSGDESM